MPKPPLNDYYKYSQLAYQLILIIGLGIGAGRLLDVFLSVNKPYFTLLFSVVAVCVALYFLIKVIGKNDPPQ